MLRYARYLLNLQGLTIHLIDKLISGGQTGVDRAALDVALENDFPCSGFCPKGRKAEDGTIAARYPLQEHNSENYAKRTLENVKLSDGTLIIYYRELKGGTALTVQFCKEYNKPHVLVDAQKNDEAQAAKTVLAFVDQHNIRQLNVAGPRKSQWADGYQFTYRSLELILSNYLKK